MDSNIKAYQDYLIKEKNYSPLTVQAYIADVLSFQQYLQDSHEAILMEEVIYSQIRSWIVVLVENNIQTKSGTVRKDISKKMESAMTDFYTNYTKKDPKLSVPKNIHAIAVTETYSTLNRTRLEYAREVNRSNDSFQIVKTWKHNSSMSKIPRQGHRSINGTTIPIDAKFLLIGENKKSYYVDGPYDNSLPPEEVITCSCELVFKTIRIKKD